MQQAVEDAELAIAVLQRKLADAEATAQQRQQEVIAVRKEADIMRGGLEQKVRTATEDSTLRVRLLEETVEKLGSRTEQSSEIARLSSEVSKLQRSEARLRSDLIFAEDRVTALSKELQASEQALSSSDQRRRDDDIRRIHGAVSSMGGDQDAAVALLSETDTRERIRQQQHDVVAKLVERAETAEVELGREQSKVGQLQQQLRELRGTKRKGDCAAASASKV